MATGTAYALDFERPLIELEKRIGDLKNLVDAGAHGFNHEIQKLEKKAQKLKEEIFHDLTRWQVVQLSRHPSRPYFLDYVKSLCSDFIELCGDRSFGDDASLVGGFARFDGQTVLVLGHQKGRNTRENMLRNFGMPRPEGYRKARRLMELAERFGRPILTFIDTPGAYPGIGAEERGQAEAIAVNLEVMSRLKVPIISTVIGEGGSGGALAIGVGNRVLMMEHSIYSVISPEACSSILYRDATMAEKAADSLRLTARDLLELNVIDECVKEPPGGAHRDPQVAAKALGSVISKHLAELSQQSAHQWVESRYVRFRALGVFSGR